jgi:hypothetical protein
MRLNQTRFEHREAFLSALPSGTGSNDVFRLSLDPSLPFKALYLYLAAWTDPEQSTYFVKAELVFQNGGVPTARIPFCVGNDPTGALIKHPKVILATTTNSPGPDSIRVFFANTAPGLPRSATLNPQTIHVDADLVQLNVLESGANTGHVIEALHGFMAVKETMVKV